MVPASFTKFNGRELFGLPRTIVSCDNRMAIADDALADPALAGRGARRIGLALAMVVAGVWVCNGLVFKLLHVLPRHLAIVQAVPGLGGGRGVVMLQLVGVGELLLAGWVLSGRWPRACAAFQTAILLTMNVMELIFARSHLLTPVGLVPINLLFLGLAWVSAELRAPAPFYWLRRHPFSVTATFEHSIVLTYAMPEAVLRPLLPPGLKLDTYLGYGFVAVAMVQTRQLRPAAFPAALGQDFILIGYRIFTIFRHSGRTRRGLFILRSDADRRVMVWLGNLLTHYRYRYAKAKMTHVEGSLDVQCRTPDGQGDVSLRADLTVGEECLPDDTIFDSVKAARRFAGPLPYTFDYESATHSIVVIKGERQTWKPQLVPVTVERVTFFDAPPFAAAAPKLCSAFHVHDIAYRWRRGVRVSLADQVTGTIETAQQAVTE